MNYDYDLKRIIIMAISLNLECALYVYILQKLK